MRSGSRVCRARRPMKKLNPSMPAAGSTAAATSHGFRYHGRSVALKRPGLDLFRARSETALPAGGGGGGAGVICAAVAGEDWPGATSMFIDVVVRVTYCF